MTDPEITNVYKICKKIKKSFIKLVTIQLLLYYKSIYYSSNKSFGEFHL